MSISKPDQDSSELDRKILLGKALLEYMTTFPEELPGDLLEAVAGGGAVMLNGGDFSLKRRPTEDLFYESMRQNGFEGPTVVFLSTPSVRFAYDPQTGKEISNTMERYGIKDRAALLGQWAAMLRNDIDSLRGKGLEGLAAGQDEVTNKIEQVIEKRQKADSILDQ